MICALCRVIEYIIEPSGQNFCICDIRIVIVNGTAEIRDKYLGFDRRGLLLLPSLPHSLQVVHVVL